jgi:hypothetical protein
MSTRWVAISLACLVACSIEPTRFTPLGDATDPVDGSESDAPPTDGPAIDAATPDATTIDAAPTTPTVPVPRRPLNNAYTGSFLPTGARRPTFAWMASSGATPITYELQVSASATFASGVTTFMTSATSYRPAADLSVSATPPVGRRHYWRVRACAPVVSCSSYSPTWWVNVGRSDRDFNGDGYADILAGAPERDVPVSTAGTVFVYFGAPNATFDTVADGAINGSVAGEFIGRQVASAGDVNGDGFSDVVLSNGGGGATANSDRAWVYYGGAGASFDTTADGALTGPAGSAFGSDVAAAGDVNADGFDDLVIGGANVDRAYVFLGGSSATFDATADGVLMGGSGAFGAAVASAGDVNGDGRADIVVGDHLISATGTQSGAAYIFLGAAGTSFDGVADRTIAGPSANGYFGKSVASAGDVNGDGFADVVIGASRDDAAGLDAGRAYVYLGGPGTFDATPDATIGGQAADDELGTAVASAGDVNGDGFADVVLGAPLNDAAGGSAGRAYVYLGGPGTSFDSTVDGTLTGAALGDFLGQAVASAGDVNGDGFADVVVGAQGNDAGGLSAGAVHVYLGGSAASFDPTADHTFTATAGDFLGWSVD